MNDIMEYTKYENFKYLVIKACHSDYYGFNLKGLNWNLPDWFSSCVVRYQMLQINFSLVLILRVHGIIWVLYSKIAVGMNFQILGKKFLYNMSKKY